MALAINCNAFSIGTTMPIISVSVPYSGIPNERNFVTGSIMMVTLCNQMS